MKVLIVSPCGTHPTNEGNRQRILALSNQLQALGHAVHLALLPNSSFEPGNQGEMRQYWGARLHVLYPSTRWDFGFRWRRQVARLLARLGLAPVSPTEHLPEVDAFYFDWWNIQLRLLQYRHRFDVVMAEYVFAGQALLAFPAPVLRVMDTHDIFSGRSQAIFAATGQQTHWLSLTADAEVAGLARAHRILGIQDEESNRLRDMTTAPVVTVGHFLPAPGASTAGLACAQVPTVLVVGSSSTINAHGVKWLIDAVLPELLKVKATAKLRVVGNVAKIVRDELGERPGVEYVGPVDDLAIEYGKAHVVVNPVQFGTGLAIKSIEALNFGKALVCTTVGARGIATGDQARVPLVADDPVRFAEVVAGLLGDDALRETQEHLALEFVASWNRRQLENLKRAISPASPDLQPRPA